MIKYSQTTGDHATLIIQGSERPDTGDYKVKLRNDSGTAEAVVKVNVLGETNKLLLVTSYY